MASKRVTVMEEAETGRNLRFRDNLNGGTMTRAQFVSAIEDGKYAKYHVRKINGVKTPVSNPDGKEHNNLD